MSIYTESRYVWLRRHPRKRSETRIFGGQCLDGRGKSFAPTPRATVLIRTVNLSTILDMPDSAEMRILLKRATNRELPMGALAALQALRKVLDDLEYEAIVSARSKGASASEIADALGMTRQAVYLRIHRHENAGAPGSASGSR